MTVTRHESLYSRRLLWIQKQRNRAFVPACGVCVLHELLIAKEGFASHRAQPRGGRALSGRSRAPLRHLWRDDDSALIEGHIAHLRRAGQGISGGTDGDTDEGGVDAIHRRLHPDQRPLGPDWRQSAILSVGNDRITSRTGDVPGRESMHDRTAG